MSLKILFMGTPDFAVPILEAINNSDNKIVEVYTQPAKKKDRGQKIQNSSVYNFAKKLNIQVRCPTSLADKEELNHIITLNPDVVVVVAYGQMLPKDFLNLDKIFFLNVHASLLPKWRGAAPIQRAIMNMDKETGISIMKIVEKLDAGNIFLIKSQKRDSKKTSRDYFEILAKDGADLMMQHLNNIQSEVVLNSNVQDEKEATYAKKISKSEAFLNLENKAEEIVNTIMALNPFPISRITFRQKEVKIFNAELTNISSAHSKTGSTEISDELLIATDDFYIRINLIQMRGGQLLTGKEFIKNYQLKSSENFYNV